ncbi:motility protein A [Salinarimonas ramus]|uniref:Flagellar motor protein PomA n=1 Tax=Salinarimonas ramus TaxID=690164 RepID=A0A917QK13_9HYPH|nr:MotA/TolQ/ExbB proton channel family protein [Salinarimonas ramus]GGK54093.1 flagellar motor protein PomA [Salinarimonas ramus]
MDFATALGLVAGVATVLGMILIGGGSLASYYDTVALVCVVGGAFASTMVRFTFPIMMSGLPMGIRYGLSMQKTTPRAMLEEITQVADVVRKSGPMGLENVKVENPTLAQGLRYIADGYDRDFIKDALEKDRDNFVQRLDDGSKVWRGIGDVAPAWGMISTVVGMIMMFANMEDPSKLGPAMAVSLLGTLYGSLVANLIALPIADKLSLRLTSEDVLRSMIIDGVLQIRDQRSPTIVREMLTAYLPEHHREEMAEA